MNKILVLLAFLGAIILAFILGWISSPRTDVCPVPVSSFSAAPTFPVVDYYSGGFAQLDKKLDDTRARLQHYIEVTGQASAAHKQELAAIKAELQKLNRHGMTNVKETRYADQSR